MEVIARGDTSNSSAILPIIAFLSSVEFHGLPRVPAISSQNRMISEKHRMIIG
jgi:hypothetical protein